MRSFAITAFGGADRLGWCELPVPEPAPGQVLVRVEYAGVNPADWKTREGMLSRYIDYRFPFVLGFDLSGVVESIGPGVTEFAPGDRVYGTSMQGQGQNGSYSEYCCAYAAMLARVPADLPMEAAAAFPTAGITAYGGLVDVGEIEAGKSVLINGAAGGVGSIALQIAKAYGARVAGTCSPANNYFVESMGAELVIDYNGGNVAEAVRRWSPNGVDIVLDAVGLDSLLPKAKDIVRQGGTYVEIETLISAANQTQIAQAADHGFKLTCNMVAVSRLADHFQGLAALIRDQKIKPPPIDILPLSRAGYAHNRLQAGHVRGKIVLEINAFAVS